MLAGRVYSTAQWGTVSTPVRRRHSSHLQRGSLKLLRCDGGGGDDNRVAAGGRDRDGDADANGYVTLPHLRCR
jgi:hypothetical protein